MPQKPFEISEEDFRKTVIDYLMFQKGIDSKQFAEQLNPKVMYSSTVKEDGNFITVTMEKSGVEHGED